MVKHLYAKDLKAANQFPLRPAGMRVSGCFCVRLHDVQMSSTSLEGIRDMVVRPSPWAYSISGSEDGSLSKEEEVLTGLVLVRSSAKQVPAVAAATRMTGKEPSLLVVLEVFSQAITLHFASLHFQSHSHSHFQQT
jgi:hypothetical protein